MYIIILIKQGVHVCVHMQNGKVLVELDNLKKLTCKRKKDRDVFIERGLFVQSCTLQSPLKHCSLHRKIVMFI